MSASESSPPRNSITADRQFSTWLQQQGISLGCTTYQTSRLLLLGASADGKTFAGFERIFDRAMGLFATGDRLFLSSKYQIWQLDNVLSAGQEHRGYDRLYVPRVGYTTGDLDVHDIAIIDRWVDGTPWQDYAPSQAPFVFVSPLLNCIATISPKNSCLPLWKPPFISKIINEDRCHLNGLAVKDGQPSYVTATSQSDIIEGWRDRRRDGGVVIDVASNDIIVTGLSMPHSPRWYRDRLWVLNSGQGELGYVDLDSGTFEPVVFCPGFLRGLAFWQNFAIVGLSKPRGDKGTFSGLALDDRLKEKDANPWCGLMIVDLDSGAIVHWVRFEGDISELYDVQVLPGVQRPMALGFQTDEISQLITLDPMLERPEPQAAVSTPAKEIVTEGQGALPQPQQVPQLQEITEATSSTVPSLSVTLAVNPQPEAPAAIALPVPETQASFLEPREERQQLTKTILDVSAEQLPQLYAGELGDRYRAMLHHPIQYQPLTTQEQALVDRHSAILADSPQALSSVMVLLLHRLPYQLPRRWFEPIKIPAWFVNDYLPFMLTPPLTLQSAAETESYANYLSDWFEFLHRRITLNPTSDTWKNVACFVAQSSEFIPIPGHETNLKNTLVNWGAIAEFALETQGFSIHKQCLPRSSDGTKIRFGLFLHNAAKDSYPFAALPAIAHLDRTKFEIILYSTTAFEGAVADYVEGKCDRATLLSQDLAQAVEMIRQDELDLLLLGSDIATGSRPTTFLAMHRLARVQVASPASPTTSGIGNVDYYISDRGNHSESVLQEQFSEKLICLEGETLADIPPFAGSRIYSAKIAEILEKISTPQHEQLPEPELLKRVISFCLWGANPKYTIGAIKNADLAPEVYPGWICRYYVDETVPNEIIEQLRSRPHVEVIQLNGDLGWKTAFCRFWPVADPDVGVTIIRDTDSRLNQREKAAVDAWLNSPHKFHIMRDHPRHNLPMLAGMWGTRGQIPDIATQIDRHLVQWKNLGLCYGIDQHFLATQLYPRLKSSCLVHDEIFAGAPFPESRHNNEYVGQVFLEDDSKLELVDELLVQYLANSELLSLQTFERPVTNAIHPVANPSAPHSIQALFDRSRLLKQQGKLEEAETALREVIRLYPNHWGAHNNLGTLLQKSDRISEATACYQQALQLNTNFAEAHSNLASIWQLDEDYERAKEGFFRALQLKPDYVPAHYNLATIYQQQRRMAAAVKHYQKVLSIEPNYPGAQFSLGQLLEYQGNVEDALTCYQKATDSDPDASYLQFYISLVKLRMCDWTNYTEDVEKMQQTFEQTFNDKYTPNPFITSTFDFPLSLHKSAAVNQSRNVRVGAAKYKSQVNFIHSRNTPGKLRIGYISPDFRDHAVGRLIMDMFALHDRDKFEVFAYNTVDYRDFVTERVASDSDVYVNLPSLTTAGSAQRIYNDGIHILIDLAGYTIGNSSPLLSLQPAPIQAQWLGYPDTLGADYVQYAIADEWIITPEIEDYYSEKIVYLPQAFVGTPLEISGKPVQRSDWNLPDSSFVFCCFNSHYKITPQLFDIWMQILKQVPESVLWLIEGSKTAEANLRQEAEARGISGDRLIFSPKIDHAEYLARYQLADLYLDTLLYSAGSTAVAASWSGLPILTYPGKTNSSRMGASICDSAGMGHLICKSLEEYKNRAIYLATYADELATIRHTLQNSLRSPSTYPPLFQVKSFTQYLETAYQEMWRLFSKNQSPQTIHIKG
ncbi:MAG: TIGR03032 family protein [Synechococcus sp.]